MVYSKHEKYISQSINDVVHKHNRDEISIKAIKNMSELTNTLTNMLMTPGENDREELCEKLAHVMLACSILKEAFVISDGFLIINQIHELKEQYGIDSSLK